MDAAFSVHSGYIPDRNKFNKGWCHACRLIGLYVMMGSKVAWNGSSKINVARYQFHNLAGDASACLDFSTCIL